MKWCMLPILADSRAQMCRSQSGRFIGDPTYEYEYIDMKVVGEGEEAEEETNTVSFQSSENLFINLMILHITRDTSSCLLTNILHR